MDQKEKLQIAEDTIRQIHEIAHLEDEGKKEYCAKRNIPERLFEPYALGVIQSAVDIYFMKIRE